MLQLHLLVYTVITLWVCAVIEILHCSYFWSLLLYYSANSVSKLQSIFSCSILLCVSVFYTFTVTTFQYWVISHECTVRSGMSPYKYQSPAWSFKILLYRRCQFIGACDDNTSLCLWYSWTEMIFHIEMLSGWLVFLSVEECWESGSRPRLPLLTVRLGFVPETLGWIITVRIPIRKLSENFFSLFKELLKNFFFHATK